MSSITTTSAASSISTFGYLRLSTSRPVSPLATNSNGAGRQELRDLLGQVRDLRRALERWQDATRFGYASFGTSTIAAVAESSTNLSLANTTTAAEMVSTEEINTTPTSYGAWGPEFSGLSTTEATVGGTYGGSRGDTTLSFNVKKAGVVGVDNVIIDVQDNGTKIDTLTFNGAAGQTLTTSTGLTLSLSDGLAAIGDSFEVTVSSTVGTAVDPDAPFDGVRNQDPRLDPGESVVSGLFEINGVAISVGLGDSLQDVLSRISQSAAGVDASFDVATERVILTQQTPGAGPSIVLGNDTSGFLDAFKLSAATVVVGSDGATDRLIQDVASLSGISTGSFSINGTILSLDVTGDTLQDVLDRINSSNLGVSVTYDEATDRVDIRSDDLNAELSLGDGTSGFFSGLSISAGTYSPSEGSEGETRSLLSRRRTFERRLRSVSDALQGLFGESYSGTAARKSRGLRTQLEARVREIFDQVLDGPSRNSLESGLGIDFDFDAGDEILQFDAEAFGKALRTAPRRIRGLLEGSRQLDRDGLADALLDATRAVEDDLRDQLALSRDRGGTVDVLA